VWTKDGSKNSLTGRSEAVYGDGGVGLKTGGVAAGHKSARWVSLPARGGSDGDRRFYPLTPLHMPDEEEALTLALFTRELIEVLDKP
jgi:hypothetical protein